MPIRALTVRVISLSPNNHPYQTTLFSDNEKYEKNETIENTIEEIRGRYGKASVTFGSLLNNLKLPKHYNREVIMPSAINI